MKKGKFSKEYDEADMDLKQVYIFLDGEILKRRKTVVEHVFGTIKRCAGAGYFLTRGLLSTVGEMALSFLSYNMKRVINIVGVAEC